MNTNITKHQYHRLKQGKEIKIKNNNYRKYDDVRYSVIFYGKERWGLMRVYKVEGATAWVTL